MAEKLTTAAAVRALLDGSYVAEMCPNTGKTRKYTVHLPDKHGIGQTVGRITPKQFDELAGTGVIEPTRESGTDKYGNIYNFYELRPTEAKAEVAREIFAKIDKRFAALLSQYPCNGDFESAKKFVDFHWKYIANSILHDYGAEWPLKESEE